MLLPHLQVHVGWLPEGTAVFAFRGTDTAQDGLQDVKIMRRNIDYLQDLFPGVKAHVGGCCSASLLNHLSCLVSSLLGGGNRHIRSVLQRHPLTHMLCTAASLGCKG